MKRQVIILFSVFIFMLFSSCDSKTADNEQTTDEIQVETYVAEITDTYDSDLQLLYDNEDISWAYLPGYGGVGGHFISLVDENEYNDWLNSFDCVNPQGTRDGDEYNIYTFIKEFNISKEDFIKANESFVYTDEEIDLLFNSDEEYVLDRIVNPYAVRIGHKIYTPFWLATHTADDYRAEGITPEMLSEKADKIRSLFSEYYADYVQTFDESCSELAENAS